MKTQEKYKDLIEEFWNHPALKYANSMITFNALRSGTRGWEGESGNVALAKLIREVEKESMDRYSEKVLALKKTVKELHPEATLNPLDEETPFLVSEKNGYNKACDDMISIIKSSYES